jgi:hypothetical protein
MHAPAQCRSFPCRKSMSTPIAGPRSVSYRLGFRPTIKARSAESSHRTSSITPTSARACAAESTRLLRTTHNGRRWPAQNSASKASSTSSMRPAGAVMARSHSTPAWCMTAAAHHAFTASEIQLLPGTKATSHFNRCTRRQRWPGTLATCFALPMCFERGPPTFSREHCRALLRSTTDLRG